MAMPKLARPVWVRLVTFMILTNLVLTACGDATPTTPPATNAPSQTPASTTLARSGAASALATTVATSTTTSSSATLAPAPPTPAGAKKGGSVTLAANIEGLTMHPYNVTDGYSFNTINLVYTAKMTRRDPTTLAAIGQAAASWNLDQQAKTVTFKLKDGLLWSDGQPITSDDYLWTYQQAIKKENKWPQYAQYIADPAKPDSIGALDLSAPDPKTVVVKLSVVTFDSVSRADFIEPLPHHIWEGKDWLDPAKNPEIDNPSVVSGPWIPKKWDKGSSWTAVANPKSTIYPVPYLDALTVVFISAGSEIVPNLQSGAFDSALLWSYADKTQKWVAQVEASPNLTIYKGVPVARRWSYIGFNFRQPYLQDVKLRQALAYALNKKAILDQVFPGQGEPLYSDVPPSSPEYDDNAVNKYAYEPEKAKQLLKDAGYTLKEGKLVGPDGKALPKLKLLYPGDASNNGGQVGRIAFEEWKALGLEVELYGHPFPMHLNNLISAPFDYDLFYFTDTLQPDPEANGDFWRTIPVSNHGAYASEALNKLYASALTEFDMNKRKQLMSQVQKFESNELPVLYLIAYTDIYGVNKRIGGVSQSPLGPAANRYTDWYIKA